MGKGETYKVIVIGAGGVGKSCLCLRYLKGTFLTVRADFLSFLFK